MKSSNKLEIIDALRGLAVIAVIAFHHRLECEYIQTKSLIHTLTTPARFGHIGVNLFLVLSGFCLNHSFLRRARSGRSTTLRRFMADRWWRIGPPYLAAMIVYLGVSLTNVTASSHAPGSEPINLRQIVAHLTFTHGLARETFSGISPPFWSLSLEFQFYVTMPLLVFAASRAGYRWLTATIVAAALLWRAAVLYGLTPGDYYLLNGFFLGRWPEFVLGMGVAFWWSGITDVEASAGRSGVHRHLAAGLAVFGLGLCLVALGRFRWAVLVSDLTLGIGIALVLKALLLSVAAGGGLAHGLARPWLCGVGVISYSLYLTHSLVLACIDRPYLGFVSGHNTPASDLVLMLVAYSAVAALGIGFYAVVERRFLRSVGGARPPGVGVAIPASSYVSSVG